MSYRVTIACPEEFINAANQYALTIGLSLADVNTFSKKRIFEDKDGNLYSVSSGMVSNNFPNKAQSDLTDLVNEKGANLSQVNTIQSKLVIWYPLINEETGEYEIDPPKASSNKLTAIIHSDVNVALSLLGLERKETEEYFIK